MLAATDSHWLELLCRHSNIDSVSWHDTILIRSVWHTIAVLLVT